MGKTCCVTGHRKLPQEKLEEVKAQLRQEILAAVEDGYDNFISGFAEGTDLLFAEMVLELKKRLSIRLEAAIPYRNRIKSGNAAFQKLLSQCEACAVLIE